MRTLPAFITYLALALPAAGVLILLQKIDRKNRQDFPPTARDIIVPAPVMHVYGH